MLIRKDSIDLVTHHNNGLANLIIGCKMNMSLLQKNLMSYVQTEGDKADEKLLRRLLSEKMPKKDADKIINHCFSDLIKWTYDDAVFQLTEIFSFTDQECEQLLKEYDILSATTEEVIMNPAPNFNATAPRDVKDLAENLWQARKYISTAKKLISATALTPDDYDNQKDFQEAVVQRANVNFHFISITKYIDEMSEYTKGYVPLKK